MILEEYYTAVANDPIPVYHLLMMHRRTIDRNKAIFLQAKNDSGKVGRCPCKLYSYKYSEDFAADDPLWMYGTLVEYLDFAKQMKEWADKGFWSKSAIAKRNGCQGKPLLTEQVHLSSQNLWKLWVQRHPRWSRTIRNGSLRYVIRTPDAHRFLAAYTGDGELSWQIQEIRAFMALDPLKL